MPLLKGKRAFEGLTTLSTDFKTSDVDSLHKEYNGRLTVRTRASLYTNDIRMF